MAFIKEYLQPQRWDHFSFYFDGKTDGWEDQTCNPGTPWKLEEIRLHFSSAFASVASFTARVNASKGTLYSMFNTILASEALNGVTDLRIKYSEPFIFNSDTTVVFHASMKSALNGWGLEVLGWAVRG